jgi:cell division septum initiation protein DivIVA
MSERRERSFLRRARESRDAVDGDPSPGPEAMSDPPESRLGETEPPEPGGYRRGSELRRSMAIAAERVDEIITTAHQMAEEIRREAEAEADRLVEIKRREADLIAEERLAGVRAALGTLRVEIDQIERRMIEAARGQTEPAPTVPASVQTDPPRRGPQVVQTSGYPGVASERAGEPSEKPRWADERAAALIRASQLAVQGESRERIETVLRDDFGIQEPAEIVDEILPRRR